MADDSFAIRLPQFEGPFDLLLFFIERDELDIHEIAIARIADDFLIYIHQMNSLNMELASEFIFVAATLMRIKAKMLLPRYETEANDNEVDSQNDLIQKLVEYKKFKDISAQLRVLEDERLKQAPRGNIAADLAGMEVVAAPGKNLADLTLYRLLQVYERVNRRHRSRNEDVTHTVIQYPYTIEQQKQAIDRLLSINGKLDFNGLVKSSDNRLHFIYNFLAMLEMLQQELIDIQIGLDYNNFWIAPKTPH